MNKPDFEEYFRSILHKMIELNLHDLVDENISVLVDVEKKDCSIFCRKILEYSHV